MISGLPENPGVYQFMDESGRIIYVGKAKNLRKRVASYFTGNQTGKTAVMLKRAVKITHTVVENESDALLLENNLIKKHQPKYNILLKDDKTFPWICVKNEPFPRVLSTRKITRDGSSYYGPYTSALMVRTLIGLIRQLYKLRTCSYRLTSANINTGKFKVCLEYHIGNCKAPCTGKQSENEYLESINQIKEILKGNILRVTEYLRKKMTQYASDLRFEEAQVIKEKIDLLNKFRSRSAVVSKTVKNVDVFGFTQDADKIYVHYLKVIEGAVIQSFTLDLKPRVDEDKESVLGFSITEIRQRYSSDSPEIIVSFKPDIQYDKIKYTVPKKGEKLKLLELAERNAVYYRLEQKKKQDINKHDARTGKNLEKVMKDLHMPEIPQHIECFDNSNIMGENPVAACVVFRNGRPSKKEYRHFNVKTVTGPDDFASMEEIVFRRYKRMTEENKSMPQLVIIDGGKGQLSSAIKSIDRLGLRDTMTVIGIAKKLEEIYFPGDTIPIYLDKNSYTLKLIQHLRNEAHRFGINFHRDKRSAGMLKSDLDNIKGIGPGTKELLLKNFDSVHQIKNADKQTLKKLIGVRKATIISDFYKSDVNDEF